MKFDKLPKGVDFVFQNEWLDYNSKLQKINIFVLLLMHSCHFQYVSFPGFQLPSDEIIFDNLDALK